MIDDETDMAKLFNEFFVNIVKKLEIITNEQTPQTHVYSTLKRR